MIINLETTPELGILPAVLVICLAQMMFRPPEFLVIAHAFVIAFHTDLAQVATTQFLALAICYGLACPILDFLRKKHPDMRRRAKRGWNFLGNRPNQKRNRLPSGTVRR